MVKPTNFSRFLSTYLTEYLPSLRNASKNTISSYCDTFRLLLTFCRDNRGLKIERLEIKDFTAELVKSFLHWILNERKCSISTRNQRLAAIHAFFKYAQTESPQDILGCQSILQIPFTKKEKAVVNYLSIDEMTRILSQPDASTAQGRRDLCFLSVLYDTGARISEMTALKVRDVRLGLPPKMLLYGKGRKFREVPILSNTASHLQFYLQERRLTLPEKLDHPLFFNKQGGHLSRNGAKYILDKYVSPAEIQSHVTPHVLRHTKAMHLLDAGINIFYIKGLLGHEDISTTEVYAKASVETQRTELEKYSIVLPASTPSWAKDGDTLEWLKNYGRV